MPLVERHININVDSNIKKLFGKKMESEEFLSFLQVCKTNHFTSIAFN